jgi:hypothetical protein
VPRINPDDYLDFDDEDSLDIQNDDPVTVSGRRATPKPTKEDRDWEDRRKALIQHRLGRERD